MVHELLINIIIIIIIIISIIILLLSTTNLVISNADTNPQRFTVVESFQSQGALQNMACVPKTIEATTL